MIDPVVRFQWTSGSSRMDEFGKEVQTTCYTDADQRRPYFIILPAELEDEDELIGCTVLQRIWQYLSPDIQTIKIDKNCLLESISNDRPEECWLESISDARLPLLDSSPGLQNCPKVQYSKLVEVDRLEPFVDLMVHSDSTDRQVIFKYNPCRPRFLWNEIHILQLLPSHPNIVPLDHIVLADVEARILGFTTRFVKGGDFAKNKTRLFKVKWLQQLTDVLDYLHLEVGVAHGDIQPKNLLFDPETDNLQLIDFGMVSSASEYCIQEDMDLTYFALYAIITLDLELFPTLRSYDTAVLKDKPWPTNRKLDCEASQLRKHLDDWVKRRKETRKTGSQATIKKFPGSGRIEESETLAWPELELYDEEEEEDDAKAEEAERKRYKFPWRRPSYAEAYPERVSKKRQAPDSEAPDSPVLEKKPKA
ncbi:Uu.00g021740.m01.CDS01 [Anthostomella pinea]|uniref:non-specific serine/threonine protein kinase n=1 Tax=Anthostomella pinea TaxID=933095 RepID=A0AAI8W0M8_9PEZI|nr:Uu.00g021740.m01.CDS01 [Anthostomella pinea]